MSQNKKRKLETDRARERRFLERANERRRRRELFLKLGIGSATDIRPIRDYYVRAFMKWFLKLRTEGAYDPGPSPSRWAFWQAVPAQTYAPEAGMPIVQQYLTQVEDEMRKLVASASLPCWLHVIRRLAPVPIGEDPRPGTVLYTRASLEAAVQKWAPFAPCDRIAKSSDVPPKSILRGELVSERDEEMLKVLATEPQLVLTDFGPEGLVAVADAEKLGYECWRSMAELRALGKGVSLVVTGREREPIRENRTNELDYLIRNYDQRVEQTPFNATATATVFGGHGGALKKRTILLPQYNARHVTFKRLAGLFEGILKMPLHAISAGFAGPNFVWSTFDLGAYYDAHRPLSEPFRATHGISLESVLAVIAAISMGTVGSWSTEPGYFWQAWQRAYEGPLQLAQFEERLEAILPTILRQLGSPFSPAEISIRDGVEFLTLREEKRAAIDVGFPGPHYVFLPFGPDRFFVDYAHIGMRLYYLFHNVKLADQNFKGDALEAFTRRLPSPLPPGQLRGKDGTSRQIDAAFGVGDVLVIAECRAVARSIAVERGDPKAMEKRRSVVEKALQDIDEKARWLATRPVGRNYDVSAYRTILPVGVTPFREYVPSRDARYWISLSLPRVLSPDELLAEIDKGSLTTLAAEGTCCVPIGK
jgi:hypothetical protein